MAKMTPKKIEKLAKEILDFLIDREMWIDTTIFFNNKAYTTTGSAYTSYNNRDNVITKTDIDPRDYFEYVNNILSMSFEGPLYDALNYNDGQMSVKIEEEFSNLLKKYGLYYELGNPWNLTLYEM